MKKNILVWLGLSLSLMASAQNQVVHPFERVNADPVTCQYQLTVKSTLDKSRYTLIEYYYSYDLENPIATQKDSLQLTLDQGYYQIIVVAGTQQINAPARQESIEEIPYDELPHPYNINIVQYDIYEIRVTHPVVEHWDTIYADLLTGEANYGLYTTIGATVDGKTYCGDVTKAVLYEAYEGKTNLHNGLVRDLPYEVTTTAGDYTYFVNVGTEQINAPARHVDIPTSDRLQDVWTDVFYIRVIEPDCYDNLVYTKWNDVLFVDNGGNAQGFERGDFVAYQWYNEGAAIEGEMGQWMRTKGAPQGRYYAEITTKDGKKVFSCPAEFETLPQSEPLNQHKSGGDSVQKRLVNGRLLIQVGDKTYNAVGTEL